MRADDVYAILNRKIKETQNSGSSVSEYQNLDGKPQINGVTLQDNLTSEDLGIKEFSGKYQDLEGIPETLSNPYPITFSGIIPEISYDGTQAVNVMFPTIEMMNEVVGTPVGEIISFMGNIAPVNYLACDGTVYNIMDYPELAQHFATEFGTSNHFGGDGETTFAVPDLRGEVLRGTGTKGHENSGNGARVGLHQQGTVLTTFVMSDSGSIMFAVPIEGANYSYTLNSADVTNVIPSQTKRRWLTSKNETPTQYVSDVIARPTNTSVLYCIKYKSTHFIRVGGGNYSFEERRIGTWVDGKPLYEKTIDFGKLPNATTKDVPHGIENIDTIWVYDGWVNNLNYSNILQTTWSNVNNSFNFYVDKINITCYSVNNRSEQSGFVTIRYTKTTD